MTVRARLFEHMAWADAAAREAVRRMPADAPELTRATAIYAHLFGAEQLWLARLGGRPAEYPVWPTLGLAGEWSLLRLGYAIQVGDPVLHRLLATFAF